MTEIVKIEKVDAEKYGIEPTRAEQIESFFTPMLQEVKGLEEELNAIANTEITEELCGKARELRLRYVKLRTGSDKVRKEQKAFFLAAGKFVDAWGNVLKFATLGNEEKLKEIEQHFERMEKERIGKLHDDRVEELARYDYGGIDVKLGEMNDETWGILLTGAKSAFEARIKREQEEEDARLEAELRAEEERVARLKKEAEEREAQRLENVRLKEEAEERERVAEAERKAAADELARQKAEADAKLEEQRKEAEKKRKALEAKAKKERAAAEKIRKAQEEKARKEREAREKEIEEEKRHRKAELDAIRLKAKMEREKREREADAVVKKAELRAKTEIEARDKKEAELEEAKRLIESLIECPKCGHKFHQ